MKLTRGKKNQIKKEISLTFQIILLDRNEVTLRLNGNFCVHASSPISRRPGKARLSTLGPIRRRPRPPRGAAPPNLHPQRTIAHPPMPRSTSDPLSARRMKRWARRETAQQNHRGAAQNSCCGRSERSVGTGPAEGSHCNPQIAQSTSRWFSARGREASVGSDRGSPSHPRE